MYKFLAFLFSLLLLVQSHAQTMFEDSFEQGPCRSNDQCSVADYCAQSDIGAVGECTMRPEACIEIYDPVCGFDNQTYDNACIAASLGMNVLHIGECMLPDTAGSFTTAKNWLYDRVHFDHMTTFYCGCDYD